MTDRNAMLEHMSAVLSLGGKLKAAMKAKGKDCAWTACPYCGGKVRAVLAGRKQHLHMACETNGCTMRMME